MMEVCNSGDGPLFSEPSANKLREFFKSKPRALVDKVSTVSDAVKNLIHDGDYLAIGGFGTNRIPAAVCHEILRQDKKNLRFAGHTATFDFQILCAGNLLGRGPTLGAVDAAYIVGIEARGLSPHARRVMESGTLKVCEWSNYALAVRLQAGAMGVPFLPMRSMLGTDTFRHSAAKEIRCPFTNEQLCAVPALIPDVSAIHVHEADRFGNCRIRGTTVADMDLARASRRVIITCERLIDTEEIRKEPWLTLIPFLCVDAVCEVPGGSYPGNMPGEYFSDEEHLRAWLTIEKDIDKYKAFLQQHIYGVKDFAEYLQLCGGAARLAELQRQELLK
jgi:glutaconate CoA-transferase, subunit A